MRDVVLAQHGGQLSVRQDRVVVHGGRWAAEAWGRPGPGDTGLATAASKSGGGNTNASGAAALASRLRHARVTVAGSVGCARRVGRSHAAGKQPVQTGPALGVGGAELVSLDVTNRQDWLEEKEKRGLIRSQS